MYKAFSVKFVVNEVKNTDVATAAGAITKYGFLHSLSGFEGLTGKYELGAVHVCANIDVVSF